MFPIEIFNIIAFGALVGLTQINKRFNTYFDHQLKYIRYRLIYNSVIDKYSGINAWLKTTFYQPKLGVKYEPISLSAVYDNRNLRIDVTEELDVMEDRIHVHDSNQNIHEYLM